MIEKYYTPNALFSTYHYVNDVLPLELRQEKFDGDTVDGAIANNTESWKYLVSLGLDYKVALAYVENQSRELEAIYQRKLKEVSERFHKSIYVIAEMRAAQKKNKNYDAADAIRDILLSLGFEVKDSKDGTYELKYVET